MRQIKNPEQFRDNICNNLNKIISDIKICKNIEKGLVNYSINTFYVLKWQFVCDLLNYF